jgi:hypothetical protein
VPEIKVNIIKVDIIIPLFYNDGKPIPDIKLTKTLDELAERFSGSSRVESIIEGRLGRDYWKKESVLQR